MEPITFVYKIDLRSYIGVAFNRLYKSPIIWVIYVCFGFTLSTALLERTGNETINMLIFSFSAITILHLIIYFASRKIYNTTLGEKEVQWKIDEKGIERKNDTSFSQFSWSVVYKLSASSKWVFIYYNKREYTVFARNLISDEQLQWIQQLVLRNKRKNQKS